MNNYTLMPFRFKRYNRSEVFISNELGEYIFLSNDVFDRLVSYRLDKNSKEYQDIKSKQIIADNDIDFTIEMLATKYRTKKYFLNEFTTLHMVVPTLRCNGNCIYCQVSSKGIDEKNYDMDKTTAKRIVETIFKTPSQAIKIEFQGGEPLLNFGIVKFIILYANKLNMLYKKRIEFVICTTLILINEEILNFLKKYNVLISTSLDGPENIHNFNRPLKNENSYSLFSKKLDLTKNYLDIDRISALMTTTKRSIGNFEQIIDEYLSKGFHSIFFRIMNPYGLAKQKLLDIEYNVEDFFESYKKGLEYIFHLNLNGTFFIEIYASLLLTRILTPFSIGFVDLQSPAGAGIECAIYNCNGDVYLSDEGRMLGEMGDKKFLLGNVLKNTYEEIFNNHFLKMITANTYLETLPECYNCAFVPYCGADPVRNYLEQKDIIGNKIVCTSCQKNKLILDYIFNLIKKGDEALINVFWSWITHRALEEIRLK
ncbi:MAG: His-Xaa-Ser system radical SAM maturase HxsB [Actinobacteria bacterium]|nr:His-Xaa-Ser system radical SAM maturase HxsB [Actinomycetota bacterium]